MIAWTRGRIALLGVALAVAAPLGVQTADASRAGRHGGYFTSSRAAAQVMYAGASQYSRYRAAYRIGSYAAGLQCVPFARENTGIELAGNAANWWENAAGVYERGARPEVGSVMNFRATGRMRMGHVAVVSNVIDGRNVQIDHANWSGRGVVTRNVTVVDVSAGNDWSAVRVALGNGDFGSVYPTYGFIYDRPDKGIMLANAGVMRGIPAAAPALVASLPQVNPAPIDLRLPAARTTVLPPAQDEEVAEAADDMAPRVRRAAARALPVVTYGHDRSFAQFGRGRWDRRGEVMAAHFSRGNERMTSGRMMGGQVLFIGQKPSRMAMEPSMRGGRPYGGMVRTATFHVPSNDRGPSRAMPVSAGRSSHAEPAKHRARRS